MVSQITSKVLVTPSPRMPSHLFDEGDGGEYRPGDGTSPSQGARRPCVWYHSSRCPQTRRGRSISTSRTRSYCPSLWRGGTQEQHTHMLMRHNTTLNMLMKGCIGVRSHTDTLRWLRLTRTHTDLHSALDQVEGHYSRVCGATAEDSSEATEDKVFLWAELTAVSLWRETRSHIHLHKAWDVCLGVSGKPPRWTLKRYLSPAITPSDMSYAKGVLIF